MTEKDLLIQDLRRENAKLRASAPKWISVKDRLPEKKGTFLVYVKANNKWSGWSGYIKTTWFTPCYEGAEDRLQGKKIWYDYDSEFGDYEVRNVTHWMPLPEPPKGE